MPATERGKIKKIVEDKGFGFIQREGKKDIFFHATELADRESFPTLQEGQAVSFEEQASDRGPRAIKVTPV